MELKIAQAGTTPPVAQAPAQVSQLATDNKTSGVAAPVQPGATDMPAGGNPAGGNPASQADGITIQPSSMTPPMETSPDTGWSIGSMIDGIAGFIDLGGPVVALLLTLSVFALTIILLKFWQIYAAGLTSNRKISDAVSLWLAGNYENAVHAIRALKGPVAKVVAYAMTSAAVRRDESHLREETEHLALAELGTLKSYLRGLEAVVQVAPLLGLFGTVLGMIEAFRSLESAGAQVNPADLAGGIWVALLTTAVGLAIAMPVSLTLHWFESRIASLKASMELFITEVLTNPPSRAVKPLEGVRVRLATAAEEKNAI